MSRSFQILTFWVIFILYPALWNCQKI